MSLEDSVWRQTLLSRFRDRNRKESNTYKDIILQNNRLTDHIAQLKLDNLKLSVENEQLRVACSTGGKDAGGAQLAIASLEKKLLAQQEELTELHKRRGENSQLIVDLNTKGEQLKKTIIEKENSLAELQSAKHSLRAEVQMYKSSLDELQKLNTTLLDEHTALQLAFSALEEKLRSVQDENCSLLERLMRYKSKDADKLNEENETFLKRRSDKLRRELEDAVRDNYSSSDCNVSSQNLLTAYVDSSCDTNSGVRTTNLASESTDSELTEETASMAGTGHRKKKEIRSNSSPSTVYMKFEAHETESHAVRWNPVERLLATGGTDRKVKLWDVGKGLTEPVAAFGGSSAGINSVEFDSTGTYILGTSNDYGARVWTVADNRLRHTLTGHSGKVMAARYLQEPVKVATGSHDRTLKIWDLRSIACIETKFAGSSCNDVVTVDSLGSAIISGHYDKKIRFWDIRTEKQADDIVMPAKITSLDMSKDGKYLICSVRDDTIKLLDLRKNQILTSFSNENFKLSCDWARACFNVNATKIACGSGDGLVYIWAVDGPLEATLKGHTSAVNAVSWSHTSNSLASVGKSKRCIIHTAS